MASWPTLWACISPPAPGCNFSRRATAACCLPSLLERAVPGRDPRHWRVAEFQYGGDDLRRLRAVHRDLADRPDRRPVVAELLPGRDRRHERSRAGGDTDAVGEGRAGKAVGIVSVMPPRSQSRPREAFQSRDKGHGTCDREAAWSGDFRIHRCLTLRSCHVDPRLVVSARPTTGRSCDVDPIRRRRADRTSRGSRSCSRAEVRARVRPDGRRRGRGAVRE